MYSKSIRLLSVIIFNLYLIPVTTGQEIVKSDYFEGEGGLPEISKITENYMYSIETPKNSYSNQQELYIRKFDINNLELLDEFKIEEKDEYTFSGSEVYEGYQFYDNKIHVLKQNLKMNKDTMVEVLLKKAYHSNTGELVAIDTLYQKKLFMAKKVFWGKDGETYMSRLREAPDVSLSQDRKKILIHKITNAPETRYWQEIFILRDATTNKVLKQKTFNRENYDEAFTGNLIVDNEGSVYAYKKGKFAFFDFYQDYEPWYEELSVEKMATNGAIGNLYVHFDENQDLNIIAPYMTEDVRDTDGSKYDFDMEEGDTQLKGFVYWKMDGLNKEQKFQKTSFLSESFIDMFITPEMKEEGIKPELHPGIGPRSLEIKDKPNSNIRMTYECLFDKEQFPKKIKLDYQYFSGGVCEFRFDKDGSLQFAQRIPNMALGGTNFQGYLRIADSSKIHFFVHSHEDNFENGKKNNEGEALRKQKHALPVEYTMQPETGELDYQTRPDLLQEDYLPLFFNSRPLNDQNAALVLYRDDDDFFYARYNF